MGNVQHGKMAAYLLAQLSRPGIVKNARNLSKNEKLRQFLEHNCKLFYYTQDLKTISVFSKKLLLLLLEEEVEIFSEYKQLNSIKQSARFQIDQDLKRGLSEQESVKKTAFFLSEKHKKDLETNSYSRLVGNEKLRKITCLPKNITNSIPKSDLRIHLLSALNAQEGKSSPFKKAFSEAIEKQDNTYLPSAEKDIQQYLTILGFSDQTQKIALIKVESSKIAHMLHFKKEQIINMLKKTKGFEKISGVRFVTNA